MIDKESVFHNYIMAFKDVDLELESAPFDWVPSIVWGSQSFVYSQMLFEHSRELSNNINRLARLICKLKSWELVVEGMSDKDKFEVILEFIDDSSTVAINLPYVIKARFSFSIAHLCHQANQYLDPKWVDKIVYDQKIDIGIAMEKAKKWSCFSDLYKKMLEINDEGFIGETLDFRNKYNHRYSPKIEVGLTELIKRTKNSSGDVVYKIGQTKPLKLKNIVISLIKQHKKCIEAYSLYQKLVMQHLEVFEGEKFSP
ncbi:hypothetical protein RIN66_07160 [Hafnia alvei]|uniref:hypothetical protein n=1 Tax=Hafnia alvei TaxID=569 RepID=UPI0028BDF53A|nr:hypothetical protein [Hafnia alvei]WNN53790.1 hypothetical protein RIN66_07160 [Hafnia alvei]